MTRCGWIIGALLLTSQSAAAQWRMKTESGGLRGPVHYLTVASRERNADLSVTCSEPVMFQLDMDWRLGIFDFYGADYFVFLKARFLPDTTVYDTHWQSRAGSGYPSTADDGMIDTVRVSDPTSLAAGSPYQDRRAQLLAKLTHATTFEVELHTYGRGRPVATFRIHNHDVFDHFVTSCQKS